MRVRTVQPELMDDPALDASAHEAALRGLARLNWWSGSAGALWQPIHSLALDANGRRVRVLDLACGGGDVTIALWRRGQKAGLPIDVSGCDKSDRALALASRRAGRMRSDVRFFQLDVQREALPTDFDVLTCSLFLHHLDDAELQAFLASAGHAARRMVVVSDLRRSWSGLALAHMATQVLTRSAVVHADGPQSARAALTVDEVLKLAESAGLGSAAIRPCWPARFVMVWRKRP